MQLLLRLFINAFALWCAARFIDGIDYTGSTTGLLGLSLVFGVVNALIRPVLTLFSLPLLIITLGLFTFVLNGVLLLLTSSLAGSFGIPFRVAGFGAAMLGALLVSVVSTVLSAVLIRDKDD
jgi:putative membrane protein